MVEQLPTRTPPEYKCPSCEDRDRATATVYMTCALLGMLGFIFAKGVYARLMLILGVFNG